MGMGAAFKHIPALLASFCCPARGVYIRVLPFEPNLSKRKGTVKREAGAVQPV